MDRTKQGFIEGYVDGGEKIIKPFTPIIVEETVIKKTINVTNSSSLKVQTLTPLETFEDGNLLTEDTFEVAPRAGSVLFITINGVSLYPANGESESATAAFYVTNSDETVVRSNGGYAVGDLFKFNGSVTNYQINLDDEIKITYEI